MPGTVCRESGCFGGFGESAILHELAHVGNSHAAYAEYTRSCCRDKILEGLHLHHDSSHWECNIVSHSGPRILSAARAL